MPDYSQERRQQLRQAIAMRLRDARKKRGISGKALANSLDIRNDSLSQMERGHQMIPVELLVDWCSALKVSIPGVAVGAQGEETIQQIPSRYAQIYSQLPDSYQRYLLDQMELVASLNLEESRRERDAKSDKRGILLADRLSGYLT